jgi:hypothetical protein
VSIGLPIHLILSALKLQSLISYLAATTMAILAIAGAVTAYRLWIFKHTPRENPFGLITEWPQWGVNITLVCLGLACFAAGLFWHIAVRRDPPQQLDAVTPAT